MKSIISLLVLSLLFFCSVSYASEETEKLLKQMENMGKRVNIPVSMSRLEIVFIQKHWLLDLERDTDVEKYIFACISGSYENAGKAIGDIMLQQGNITEQQYNKVRNNCIKSNGIQGKSLALWKLALRQLQEQGKSIKSILEY